MSRDSDETRRLVEGDRQPHDRMSASLEGDEAFDEDVDDFIKCMLSYG